MKVVVNRCYGGFGLSEEAIDAYQARKGKKVYRYWQPDFEGPFVRDNGSSKGKTLCLFHFTEDQGDSFTTEKDWESRGYFYDRDVERNDADLVAVVEELGDKADGFCARLRVVEIPDGIEWEIDEYDGMEHVEEKHRSW